MSLCKIHPSSGLCCRQPRFTFWHDGLVPISFKWDVLCLTPFTQHKDFSTHPQFCESSHGFLFLLFNVDHYSTVWIYFILFINLFFWWKFMFSPLVLGSTFCEWSCYRQLPTSLCVNVVSLLLGEYLRLECLMLICRTFNYLA